jgi:hypothetical protein
MKLPRDIGLDGHDAALGCCLHNPSGNEATNQRRMSYFSDWERFIAFLLALLEGRPDFGLGTNALTSDKSTRLLPASVIFDKRPRLMRSAIACFDTPRMRAASAWEI